MEMSDFWMTLGSAIGLIFIIEGAFYAFFPRGMKAFFQQVLTIPDSFLRRAGSICIFIGLVILFILQRVL